MKTLIKILAIPFVLIGHVIGFLYALWDFTWFIGKDVKEKIEKYVADRF